MSIWTRVTADPLDPSDVLARVAAPSHGAAVLFVGTVRDHAEGREVGGVAYEAYEAMASSVLEAIAAEAHELTEGGCVALAHRVGELAVGEVSVVLATASAHRAQAYEASRHAIEEIKRRLPVWKREHYLDGEQAWVGGVDPRPGEVPRDTTHTGSTSP